MPQKSSALVERLQAIPDPRRQGQNLKPQLPDILVLGFCGVVAGCDDFVEMAAWARLPEDFFRTFLELPNGIPAHDTFPRVFAMVHAPTLQGILLGWLQQRRGLPGELIHIDGKAMRRTRRASQNLGALQVVSAWARETGLTLGQAAFTTALETEPPELRCHSRGEQGHGRQERRVVWVLPAKGRLSPLDAWAGLLTLVMVLRVANCPRTGAETIEVRHFISSLRPSARRLGRAIRGHWGIENGLHWVLDVVFREDGRRLDDRTAAENAAFLNRVALSLLRADPSPSSLKVKRKQAGWDSHYLAQLLGLPTH